VAKEREGHETSGGVCDRGTNTKDDLVTWEIRDLSARAEYAESNETIGAQGGREAEVGGLYKSDDDGERKSQPDPEEQREPVRG